MMLAYNIATWMLTLLPVIFLARALDFKIFWIWVFWGFINIARMAKVAKWMNTY